MEKLAQKNAAFVLDLLSARLAFERTGVKLYDSVIAKIERHAPPRYHDLVAPLREIRDQEKQHEEWLEEQIRTLGGYPDEVTELAKLEIEESSGVAHVVLDGHQQVSHLLHALLTAELADNAGWEVLVKLAGEAGDTKAKRAFEKRLAEEAKHLLFVRECVMRVTGTEILGRDEKMPRSMRSVAGRKMGKAAVVGGVTTALLMGVGALAASALFVARPRLARQTRRLMRV